MNKPSERIRVGDRMSISRRGNKGIYTADYFWNDEHHRKSLKTSNKKVAIQRAVKLEADLLAGTLRPTPSRTTIQAAADRYIEHLITESRRPKTITKYRGLLKSFAEFADDQGIKWLLHVTVSVFDAYRSDRKPSHSPKSMYTDGVVLKQFFRWCKSRHLVVESPLENYKVSKPPRVPRDKPSLEQVDKILASAQEPLRTLLTVLAFTGMRSGQLQRLRPQDVDLKGNWFHIQPVPGAKTHVPVKVPIHPRLRPLLEAVTNCRRAWFFTAGASARCPRGDHWLNAKRLNESFLALVKDLKLPTGRKQGGFTLHSLRGFFETHCVNAGIPQRVIDTWLGHRSDQSMASVYYKLSDVDSQRFMKMVPLGTGMPAADAGE